MTIRPIKKIKVEQENEQPVNEDPFHGLSTIPEILNMAYAQEVETRYISVIETIILRLNSEESEKIWIYGPKKITDHITAVVANVTARSLDALVKKISYDIENIHLFDLSSNSLKKTRSILYRVLEKTNPLGMAKSKFIFQIPRVADMMKLDKRIVSRMDGIKAYVKELQENAYIKIFSRVIEVLKEKEEEYGKKSVSFDFPRINSNLEEFVHFSYLMDNSYEGMSLRFFKYIYDVKEPNPYKLLNSIHLIILMAATIKRVTLCSVYEEFERRVNNVPHFKKISKDTVFRRLTDLMSLGLIARGYFTSDRLELEAEILSRDEVYLKVMLERVKKYWTKQI
ncbi:hypothetical protein NEMIN01_1761 [Nematocida minor]|uniref:uncharacterized protein n=1 Tax=Nematocida minor TaxID=1912983 RepID=UPI00221F306E|nr:uncharacterized protein NEMIN01_1761 [Nematocida minor]KAI5191977.1 hypothetical protein NEMIN01_1761 [Nematocida minor]